MSTARIGIVVDEQGRWYAVGWAGAAVTTLREHLAEVDELGLFDGAALTAARRVLFVEVPIPAAGRDVIADRYRTFFCPPS